MNIHYLQHVVFEGPGYLETWAETYHYKLTATWFFEAGYQFPSPDAIDVLVILGGPMSIHDEPQYPWLAAEKKYIQKVIDAGKKVLGICLGAQLLASCLGAAVKQAPVKEIGWYPVHPTPEAAHVHWFNALFTSIPTAFHWHGDQFAIPVGATNLASSDGNKNQAFLFDNQVLALQFHLEATIRSVNNLITHCRSELVPDNFVQDEATIKKAAVAHVAEANLLMQKLLNAFLET